MLFPKFDRVLYEINPLDEVVCQVRFPPVLRIDAEPPAGFQEAIRAQYPAYAQTNSVTMKLGGNIPPQLAQLMGQLPLGQSQTSHEFTSRDEAWKVSLARDFLTLTCKKYERWETFRGRFEVVFEAMVGNYQPSFFTRTGIRFRDVLCRSKIGLEGKPWSELLNPAITGVLGAPELASGVEGSQAVTVLRLHEMGKCGIRSFIAMSQPKNEQVFVLDSDFFTEQQTETVDVLSKLNAFNSEADNFFRWCITDTVHCAMHPDWSIEVESPTGRHLFSPAITGEGGSTLFIGLHWFGTSDRVELPDPVFMRLLCLAMVQRLPDEALSEAVTCIYGLHELQGCLPFQAGALAPSQWWSAGVNGMIRKKAEMIAHGPRADEAASCLGAIRDQLTESLEYVDHEMNVLAERLELGDLTQPDRDSVRHVSKAVAHPVPNDADLACDADA